MVKIWQFILDEWPLLVPVVLGFLAVYWLLPRLRRDWLLPGAAAGGAALACGGWLLIHREFATVEAVLFYSFSAIAILGAGLMLAQHNPIRAAMSFALVVLSSCGLFLLLAAPFLMAATIIIYGGAIIITFLFVVMLAQQGGLTNADQRSREPFLASLAGFVLLACLLSVLKRNYDTEAFDKRFASVKEKLEKAAAPDTDTLEKVHSIIDELSEYEGVPMEKAERGEKLNLADALVRLLPEHVEEINNIAAGTMDDVKKRCQKLLEVIRVLRNREGGLYPDPGLPPLTSGSATIQKVDAEKSMIYFRTERKDRAAKVDASIKVLAPDGKPLEGGLRAKDLSEGAVVTLSIESVEGKPIVKTIKLAKQAGAMPAGRGESLPARNVEALGQSLFTEYLVAVEMAGVLLLVATIGAIVIVERRRADGEPGEVLR